MPADAKADNRPYLLFLTASALFLLRYAARAMGGSRGRSSAAFAARDVGPGARASHAPQGAEHDKGRGREAVTPTEIPAKGWKDILWRTYEEIGGDRVMAVAAGVTFYGLLAIFPAVAAFVSLYGLAADPGSIQEHLTAVSAILPGGAVEIVGDQISRITSQGGGTLGFAFIVGLAISLWSANAGMKAIFDALNVAYGEKEKRSFIMLNALSILFTAGAILILLFALVATAVVPIVLDFVGLGDATEWLVAVLRWPLLLALIMAAFAVLYRYGPSRAKAEWKWVTPGSLVASMLWLIGSMLFSWYAANFGSYNETYGSLGAAIGFMTWMWLSTIVVLVGAELNAETEHQTAQDSTGAQQPMGYRRATMADTIGEARV